MRDDDTVEISFHDPLQARGRDPFIVPAQLVFGGGLWTVPHVEDHFPPQFQLPIDSWCDIRDVFDQIDKDKRAG